MTIRGSSNKKTFWQLLLLALVLAFSANSTWAQDAADVDEEDEVRLDRVVVTGSRIKRTDLEGPAPVVVLTSEQMDREGFTTVFEALNSLTQNVGGVQDDQFLGFTPTANAIDLRGLGPGRTLLLLDGRRITDYPLAYNGQSNLVNLSAIPIGMVERIEVLLGGASAIYGSDAIAGVVNVITKKNLEDHTVSLRYGDTSDGGGESIRAQLTGGWVGDRWSFTYGFEYMDREPIWAYERDYMDSVEDDPGGEPFVNSRTFLVLDWFMGFRTDASPYGSYIDPGQEACGSTPHDVYSFRPNSGYYCGRPDDVSLGTIRNSQENMSLFTNFSFELTDTTELYGSINYLEKQAEFNTGTLFWQPNFFGTNVTGSRGVTNLAYPTQYDFTGFGLGVIDYYSNQLLQRIFTEEEVGGLDNTSNGSDEDVFELMLGIRGVFADTWDWQLMGSVAQYDLTRNRRLILANAANDFFTPWTELDPLFGDPIVNVSQEEFYQPITPEEFASISGIDTTKADSSNATFQFTTTGELFEMPAGPVGFAALLEWGTQEYDITLDQRLIDGEWWGWTGTGGGGERDRYAAAAEFRFPLFSTLDLNAALRYDKYDDETEVGGAPTYNIGLEYRPTHNLLLRGNFATSFRAPDMHFIYADQSGFFTGAPDYYLCARDEPDVPLAECTNSTVSITGFREGSTFLEEETGESWSVGFVWEIVDNLSFSLDYFDISLNDRVADLNVTRILSDEADCRLGTGIVDPNSAYCEFIVGSVTRRPADQSSQSEAISSVTTGPVNRAVEETNGIDASMKYALNTEYGVWSLDMFYTRTLDRKSANYPEDPVQSYVDTGTQDLRHRFRGTLTWSYSDFSTTLLANHLGSNLTYDSVWLKDPDVDELERNPATWWFNWTASYNFTDDIRASLIVQNVTNKKPPRHEEESWSGGGAWPWFNQFVYDPYGREIFVQLDWTFGRR